MDITDLVLGPLTQMNETNGGSLQGKQHPIQNPKFPIQNPKNLAGATT